MTNIINKNPVTSEAGQCIAVARAAVGIYFALQGERFPSSKSVVVPANLCYAGIYPIVYAGLRPVFCDVDPISGNATLETFCNAYTKDVVAAIIPHMYGNPVEEFAEIAKYCKEKNILLIEDCASAMGAQSDDYSLGCIGDYVVYSTGYSKTLDLGFGGFLFSKHHDLSFTEVLEKELPDYTEANEHNIAFFSRLYRLIRNEGMSTKIEKMIFAGLPECCRDDFLHKINAEQKTWLFNQLCCLPDIICARQKAYALYESNLHISNYQRYPFQNGSVPWRYNLLIDGEHRSRIIKKCLENSLPVSDWYPRVNHLFGNYTDFPGAQTHESKILNFPLLIQEEKIEQICQIIETTLYQKT